MFVLRTPLEGVVRELVNFTQADVNGSRTKRVLEDEGRVFLEHSESLDGDRRRHRHHRTVDGIRFGLVLWECALVQHTSYTSDELHGRSEVAAAAAAAAAAEDVRVRASSIRRMR
jgi:hypothetical protein